MNIRKVIAVITSVLSISLLALTNVSASYMPTNPIDKDVDGQPAGEEYKDKGTQKSVGVGATLRNF